MGPNPQILGMKKLIDSGQRRHKWGGSSLPGIFPTHHPTRIPDLPEKLGIAFPHSLCSLLSSNLSHHSLSLTYKTQYCV